MINHKKCISCKRILTLDLFGSLKSSEDGYAIRCKGCTNYCRRQSHKNRKNPDYTRAPVFEPMKSHNTSILAFKLSKEAYILDSNKTILRGKHASADTTYRIEIVKDSVWSYALYRDAPESKSEIPETSIEGHFCHVDTSRDYWLDTVLGALQRLEIRLIEEPGE